MNASENKTKRAVRPSDRTALQRCHNEFPALGITLYPPAFLAAQINSTGTLSPVLRSVKNISGLFDIQKMYGCHAKKVRAAF